VTCLQLSLGTKNTTGYVDCLLPFPQWEVGYLGYFPLPQLTSVCGRLVLILLSSPWLRAWRCTNVHTIRHLAVQELMKGQTLFLATSTAKYLESTALLPFFPKRLQWRMHDLTEDFLALPPSKGDKSKQLLFSAARIGRKGDFF